MNDSVNQPINSSDATADVAADSGALARAGAGRWMWWFRLGRALVIATALYYVALIGLYRVVNPPASNWMLIDTLSGVEVSQAWVPIDEISPHVIRAVVTSEDARFCDHWGVDWREIYRSIARADSRGPRGASTITMQTTKNLFLWPGRSYVRKAIELPMTYVIELLWPKRRILEVYLNIAEWGPGIYGIEAAALHHFKIGAHRLSRYQATLLAASLPNPTRRKAGKPGPKTRKHAARVRKRLGGSVAGTACVFD